MIFFTADQHFGHFNIMRLSKRPFASLDEMNEAMIARWNAKVRDEDTIYILGDLFFRAAAKRSQAFGSWQSRPHLDFEG